MGRGYQAGRPSETKPLDEPTASETPLLEPETAPTETPESSAYEAELIARAKVFGITPAVLRADDEECKRKGQPLLMPPGWSSNATRPALTIDENTRARMLTLVATFPNTPERRELEAILTSGTIATSSPLAYTIETRK